VTPQEISDRLEIEDVLQRYFRSMDTWDFDLLKTVFTPDAALRYDALGGVETTAREMTLAFGEFNRHFSFMQHMAGQVLIELDGDSARASSTLRAIHVQALQDGGENEWIVYGVYHDQLERTPEGWRITRRHFRQTRSVGELAPFDRVKRFEKPPWL